MSVGLAEANRDPGVFTDPTVFDMTAHKSDQPQVTFGSGIHYCLGQAPARAELQEALPLLARRMPNLQVAGPTEWTPDRVGLVGPSHMTVTFDPAAAVIPA